jgi:hypothetical protein
MADKKPLWRIMHTAHMQHADPLAASARKGYAAELRAIADVVVPDRPQPSTLELCYDEDDEREWHYEQRTRALLLAEAERAERAG